MNEKEEALLQGVKLAVAKYGLTGFSTRNLAELSGINDANIYRFFTSKEELLLKAYEYESGIIFKTMIRQIDEAHKLSCSFTEKARKSFFETWKDLLADNERLTFCVYYYHSQYFQSAIEFHKGQLKELISRLGGYFESEEICIRTLYAMFTMLYDSAYAIVGGQAENNEQYAEQVFSIEMSILSAQMSDLFF